jgi:Glyoxalase-like domain
MFVNRSDAAEGLVPAVSAADHLLLGVSDLDRGIEWVERRTGVKAAPGGSHPGVGTRNALISLGGRRYLEIIAPDPAQTDFKFRIDVRRLSEPRLITWAAGSKDVDALAKKARASGFDVFGPQPGSRKRPDGRVLSWKTFGVKSDLAADDVDPIPFFIEWAADSLHPSQDSPTGCELLALEIAHPRPGEVDGVLARLGIGAKTKSRDRALLAATLRTPKGTLKLT